MNRDVLALAARLSAEGRPYALAMVVRREAPTSAQLGDAAIVLEDGAFHGWVGGSCTRPTVVREALGALGDGRARLIALDPDPSAAREAGVTVLPMTCHSRGRVDVYIEPVMPAPTLTVFGVAPVARSLCRLGAAMGYEVTAVDPDADRETFPDATHVVADDGRVAAEGEAGAEPRPADSAAAGLRFAVVATQGQWDEAATLRALRSNPHYLGVVASRRRFEEVRAYLEEKGVDADAIGRISNPAGLDIGARTAGEIALSILAEIVRAHRDDAADASDGPSSAAFAAAAGRHAPASAHRATTPASPPLHTPSPAPPRASAPAPAIDPICGMEVVPGPGTPRVEHEGGTYYFCCGHCKERFLSDPASHGAGAGA